MGVVKINLQQVSKTIASGLLERFFNLLVSVLCSLSFVVSKRSLRRDSNGPRSLGDTFLQPPPCFSNAELDLGLSFSSLSFLLSLPLSTMDASFLSRERGSV